MKIRQHFPNFIEVGEEEIPVHEISTIEDLHALEFVGRWRSTPGFGHFRCTEHYHGQQLLMAVMLREKFWVKPKFWVVAYVEDGSLGDLGLKLFKS